MSRTDVSADAPLPTPRPSALTSLLADPDLTVTPEKTAPPQRRARKEVRFNAEDVEPDLVRREDRRSSEGAGDGRQRGSWAAAPVAARVGDDDSDAVAARLSRLSPSGGQPIAPAASAARGAGGGSISSAIGRRPVSARSRYSFPFTDPLDKENVAVAAASGDLAVPELNATLRVQRELEALRSRRINVEDELRQRLGGSHVMREQLKAKVYSKLNVKERVFGDMISTEVPREQLLARAERSLVARARVTAKVGAHAPGQTKATGDSSTAIAGSQDEASREGSNENGGGTTSGLRRFWSHRAMCFTGAATPDLYQYRFGCVEPSDGHAYLRTTQQQHLLDVYQHVCSWHM